MSRSVARHYPNPEAATPTGRTNTEQPSAASSSTSQAAAGGAAEHHAAKRTKLTHGTPDDAEERKETPLDALVHRHLAQLFEKIRADYPLHTGDARADPTAYEGYAGIAWMHLQLVASPLGSVSFRRESLEYARRAVKLLEAEQRHQQLQGGSRRPPRVTFYCGAGGIYAILALAELANGGVHVSAAVQQLVALKEQVQSSELPDEILYGRAGYMHSLLLVRAHVSKYGSPDDKALLPSLKASIDETFDAIIARGVAFKDKSPRCPLMFAWHDTKYLGAAHGVTGILYMLMHCRWRFESSSAQSSHLRALVLGTLDYCLSLRLPSGNFPSSEKEREPDDRLVQWCHGAPGLALACLHAHEVFDEAKYLQAAVELGEVIWQRGLLRKGVGLCHGIGGNAFIFLKLHAATGEAVHLDRAVSFARFALESPHAQELAEQPDEPSSLGNGRAGFVCCLAEATKEAAKEKSGQCATEGEATATSSSHSTSGKQSSVCFPGLDLLVD